MVTANPSIDDKAVLARTIVQTVLTAPTNTELLLKVLNFDAIMEQQGLPVSGAGVGGRGGRGSRRASPEKGGCKWGMGVKGDGGSEDGRSSGSWRRGLVTASENVSGHCLVEAAAVAGPGIAEAGTRQNLMCSRSGRGQIWRDTGPTRQETRGGALEQ